MVFAPAAAPAAPKPGPDWRALDPEDVLVIDTTRGPIIVEMVPDAAPAHVARLRKLARSGLYDGRSFFRVIDGFMAQTGDPRDTGEGGSSEPDLKAEFIFRRGPATSFVEAARPAGAQTGFVRALPVVSQSAELMDRAADGKVAAWGTYCAGLAGMARDENPDSANSQFFLMRQAYPSLDKRYTAWGRVVAGLEAVRAFKTGEPVADPDRMLKVRVLADVPASERPQVMVAQGRALRAAIESARRAKGADFSVCDVEVPVRVVARGG